MGLGRGFWSAHRDDPAKPDARDAASDLGPRCSFTSCSTFNSFALASFALRFLLRGGLDLRLGLHGDAVVLPPVARLAQRPVALCFFADASVTLLMLNGTSGNDRRVASGVCVTVSMHCFSQRSASPE